MSADNHATRATIGGEKIENKEINLLDKLFEIPVYQRLYAWGKDEVETLLDDMKKAFDELKENYFIGNITTSIKTNKDGQDNKNDETNKIYMLIDGQQRLTTLWFVGFYLASKDSKSWQNFIVQGDDLRISMPIRDDEENALTGLAKNINGKENLAQSLQGYGVYQNIIDAFKCIESWFVNGNGKNIDLANFAKYIYENVCFVFVTLAQNTDLNRFFVRMNNRGKQLEKHEILKARILGEIRKVYDKNNKLKQDESDEIWKKYAKIWDLCSDMDKYIFQSASDRSIFGNPKDKTGQDNSGQSIDKIINNPSTDSNNNAHKDDDSPKKVESIIDFSTFLLHCYKLWVAKKSSDKAKEVAITKDKLLEIMWENKDSDKQEILCDDFIFDSKNDTNEKAKQNCKEFIIDMLHYRVLFDYFVIKNNANTKQGNTFRIRRLESYKIGKNTYYRLPDDSKSVSDNSPLKALTTLQNYLRVARQGEKQNYHHWLTPFLAYLDNKEISKKIWRIVKCDFVELDKIVELFERNANDDESNIISFLENLDTKLAVYQLGENNEKGLLDTANAILQDLKVGLNDIENQKAKEFEELTKWNFLNHGTSTPHYWFYRLEYYLWKNGVENEGDLKIKDKGFGDI